MPEGHYGDPGAPDLDLATAAQEIGCTEEAIRRWMEEKSKGSEAGTNGAATQIQRFAMIHLSRKGRGKIQTLTHAGVAHLKYLRNADKSDGTWTSTLRKADNGDWTWTSNGIRKDIRHVADELGTSVAILLGLLAEAGFMAGKLIEHLPAWSFAEGRHRDTLLVSDADWIQQRIKVFLKKKQPAGFEDDATLFQTWEIGDARKFEAIECLVCWEKNGSLKPVKMLRRTKGDRGYLRFQKFFDSRKFGELWKEDYQERGLKEFKTQVRTDPTCKRVAERMAEIGIAGRRLGRLATEAKFTTVINGKVGSPRVYVALKDNPPKISDDDLVDGAVDDLLEKAIAEGWNTAKVRAEAKKKGIDRDKCRQATSREKLLKRGITSGRIGLRGQWRLHRNKNDLVPAECNRDERGRVLPKANGAPKEAEAKGIGVPGLAATATVEQTNAPLASAEPTKQIHGGPKTKLAPEMPPAALMSASDLARATGQSVPFVKAFLRRYPKTDPCREEVENQRRNQPRILFRTALVWSPLQEYIASKGQ